MADAYVGDAYVGDAYVEDAYVGADSSAKGARESIADESAPTG
jgi:hypothetical protein